MHTLNGSGLATPRLMIALLETYQNKDNSIIIPQELLNYFKEKSITSRYNFTTRCNAIISSRIS